MKKLIDYINERNNFLTEYRPHTFNNSNLINVNESNARKLLNKHSKNGFIIVSPCRGFGDFNLDFTIKKDQDKLNEINNKRIREMISLIKKSNYSYIPVYGGFIENIGTEEEEQVYERSFIVFNYNKKGEVGNLDDLKEFGIELSQKFNQDSFLYMEPGQKPKYITKYGEVEFECGEKLEFNDFAKEYFTDLHKNTNKYIGKDGRSTRFTFTECYVNPSPQCYSERISRSFNNEIFLTK